MKPYITTSESMWQPTPDIVNQAREHRQSQLDGVLGFTVAAAIHRLGRTKIIRLNQVQVTVSQQVAYQPVVLGQFR